MPDIKYIPPADIIDPGRYYKPTSVFAAGVEGLEHGLTFGANLAAKIQETQRANDPEKIRADQLKADLENAKTEELIKDAQAKYERDQIFAAQERQSKLDSEAAGTEDQRIKNRYGARREESEINYRNSAAANMGSDNELGRVQAAIEARKMYGKEGGDGAGYQVQADPFGGKGSASDLPSIQSPAQQDPNADINAKLDAEIGGYFNNSQRLDKHKKYAEVSAQNAQVQKESEQLENSLNEQSVLNGYKVDIQDSIADIHTSENPKYGSTIDGLNALGKLQKTSNDPKVKADAAEQLSIGINKSGGADVLHKAIKTELPESDQKEAARQLNESIVNSGDTSLYSTDQKVLTDAGFSPKHVSDPDETLNKIGATIAGGIGASDDPEVDQAIGASEYLRAAREASKNGIQGFRVDNDRTATTSTSPDTSGGDTQSQAHLVFRGDDGTLSNAPIPQSPKDWAELSLVKKVNKSQAQSQAAAQASKQDVQNVQAAAAQDAQQQSQAAANPNMSSATTSLPDIPSQTADVGRPGIRIVNNNLEDDPNGQLMTNDNLGLTITNKLEGPIQSDVKNRLKNEIFNAQVTDLNEIPANKRGKAVADAKTRVGTEVEKQYTTFERNILKPATDDITKQKGAIDAGEKSLNQLKVIVNSPYVDTLLGNTYGAELSRGIVKIKPSGPEAAFLDNVDRSKAQNIEEFIVKVKGSSAANSEGEQKVIGQLGITRETAPQNVRNLYDLYGASLEKTRNEIWLRERLLKEGPPLEGGQNYVTSYLNSPESEPIIFNESKYDLTGNVIPGNEREPDYIKNVGYKTAKEWLGFTDPEREKVKRKAAAANATQAPAGGGGDTGGFPVTGGSNTPAATGTSSGATGAASSAGADVANTQKLSSEADLVAKNNQPESRETFNPLNPITFDNLKAATNNVVSRLSGWVHTTNVTESGRNASNAANKLERQKQNPDFRAAVEQMKQELNTSTDPLPDSYASKINNTINPLAKSKLYDPGLIDFALDAVTPQFIESLGNTIYEKGALPVFAKTSELFGWDSEKEFYQNYFARKQARQEIFDDARINSPYESFMGEMMAFAVLGDVVHGARLQAVKAFAEKFPGAAASIDYWTGGALSGKTGKFVQATKDAIAGGAEDTAAIKAMDGGTDVANTLAFTTLLRGASPYVAKVASSIFGGIKSLAGKLSKEDILNIVAQKYVDKGGSEANLKSEIENMKNAVNSGDIETYNFKDTKLAEVLKDMVQEPGGAFAKEMNAPDLIKTEQNLSGQNESRLPISRDTADINTDVQNTLKGKVADTIDLSRTEQEAALSAATKGEERTIAKDLSAQRREITHKTRINLKIRDDEAKKLIDSISSGEPANTAVNDFLKSADLDPVNIQPKATGGSGTATLADARLKGLDELEQGVQKELDRGYKYVERDLDGFDEAATEKFDSEFREEFKNYSQQLINQNAKELESTATIVEQMKTVSKSDAEIADTPPGGSLEKDVATGNYEIAPEFKSLDEFRQLINRTELNPTVKKNMLKRVKSFVQDQAEAAGYKEGWYDDFLKKYHAADVAKENIIAQRTMIQNIKASMQGGYQGGKTLYGRFAANGAPNEKLVEIFGEAEAKDIRKALASHDKALSNIKKYSTATPTPLTKTPYSGAISEAEGNITKLKSADEQLADRAVPIPADFPGIAGDLKLAAQKLGGVNQDIAKSLVTGQTEFTKSLMEAMGKDKDKLSESVIDWVTRKARNASTTLDTSGKAGIVKQLGIQPEHWQNIQEIIGKSNSDVIQKYISQQAAIKQSVELIDKLPEGTKPGFFTALLKGPNPARRIMETPYFILDLLAKASPYGSLNKKAFAIVKNLANPNIAEANQYAEDILKLLENVEEKDGYQFTKVIEREFGDARTFANQAAYAAAALKYSDKNIDKPYLNRHQAIK